MHDTTAAPRIRRRILKYSLYAFGGLLILLGAAVSYLAATFDPGDYRAVVTRHVQESTGRTLDIKGEVELSFWPQLGVRLGALTLSERNSAEPFAALESAHVSLKLLPLLSRELIASELSIVGARVALIRDAQGRLNISDLLEGDGPAPRFDIGRLTIDRSAVTFRDARSGALYEALDLKLVTGRLANAVPSTVRLELRLRDAQNNTFDVRGTLESKLTFDLGRRRHTLHGSRLAVEGRFGSIADVRLAGSGGLLLEPDLGRVSVEPFSVSVMRENGKDTVSAKAEAARLNFANATLSAESLRLLLETKSTGGIAQANVVAPAITSRDDLVQLPAASLQLYVQQGDHGLTATATAQAQAVISTRTVTLERISGDFEVAGPRVPQPHVAGRVAGDIHLDALKEQVTAALTGKVAESGLRARLSSSGFASPVYTFAVDLDRLDLDRLKFASDRKPSNPASAQQLLAPIAELQAKGTLNIGVLKAGNATARDVRLTLQ